MAPRPHTARDWTWWPRRAPPLSCLIQALFSVSKAGKETEAFASEWEVKYKSELVPSWRSFPTCLIPWLHDLATHSVTPVTPTEDLGVCALSSRFLPALKHWAEAVSSPVPILQKARRRYWGQGHLSKATSMIGAGQICKQPSAS